MASKHWIYDYNVVGVKAVTKRITHFILVYMYMLAELPNNTDPT